jgi:predicted transcriptional regulator
MKKRIFALLAMVFLCSAASAQDNKDKPLEVPLPHKVENLEIVDLYNKATKLPMWGKKHLLIFYVDPDRHRQNHEFTVELEENHGAEGEDIYGFGIVNLKDTWLPNDIIRALARKRTEKNKATIITDENRSVAKQWGLGDCNNLFIIMFVTKEGELVYCKKGQYTEEDKAEFYKFIKKYQ